MPQGAQQDQNATQPEGRLDPSSPVDAVGNVEASTRPGHRIELQAVFHRVNNVVPDSQTLQTVDPNTPLREAFRIMTEGRYSQLPVVRGNEVLGSFSYRSFALRAINHDSRIPIGELPVEEFLEELDVAHATAELSSVYQALDRDDAVLVGSPEDLQAILTPVDVLHYLNDLSAPFVQLGEIERSLRGVISYCLDEGQFRECTNQSLAQIYAGREEDMPRSVEDMTLGEMISIVRDGRNFERFSPLLGPHREIFAARFGQLNELRNAVLHFRRELTEEELEQISEARDWLLRKLRGSNAVR